MTTTAMGTRVMAANSSSEFEAAATTCRPRSLRSASAKSWVWIRVLSATTMLTKSDPSSSRDGIDPPDLLGTDHLVTGHRSSEPGGGKIRKRSVCKDLGLGGRRRRKDKKPAKIACYCGKGTTKRTKGQARGLHPIQTNALAVTASTAV